MRRLALATLALATTIAALPQPSAYAQSAGWFAQLERNRVKCVNAGKVWDGRRCQPRGFFNLKCKEGYRPIDGQCRKVQPWKHPGCASWRSACNAGNGAACGKFESKCQVN